MEASDRVLNPFPGLRRFDTDEAHLFFGREGQSTELLKLLREHRFLAVLGASGSGKSSLVRAGLLPSLYGGFMRAAGSNWRIAVMRPGTDPITKLAATLGDPSVLGSGDVEPNLQTTLIEATLRRGSLGLAEAVTEARLPEAENLLVVVDQFEELFRFQALSEDTEVKDDAAAFVKLLLEGGAAPGARIYVILTMRSDYLGDCSQFRGLPEAINRGKYLIPRMTREQRRLAIEGPVAVGGGTIAPRLVNRMLNDMGSDPDQLPILQHAAMQTWKCWADEGRPEEPLDLEHYEAIGGMDTALSLHADKAFAELSDARSRDIAEKIFRRLTERGADNREIRRPTRFGDLCAVTGASEPAVTAVIDVFRRPGRSFLMPAAGTELDAKSLIDISHESLIRGWDRLAAWVEEEGESAKVYKRLADTAALWKQDRAGLWRDPDLQFALDWWERDQPNEAWAAAYDPDFELARDFLDKSRDARDAAARARKRQVRTVMAALAIGFVGASVLALWALDSRSKAVDAEQEAVVAREEAETERETAVAAQLAASRSELNAIAAEEKALTTAAEVERQNDQLIAQRSALAMARDSAQNAAELAEFHGDRAEAAERLARVQDLNFRWKSAPATLDQLEAESRDEHAFETVDLHKTRARNFSDREMWREAIKEYSDALRADPNDLGALVNRSDAYLNIGQPDSARHDLLYALARNPHYFLAHANMALALGHLGDFEGARRHYRFAVESTAYQASETNQSKVSPDLNRVMGLRALTLDGSETRTALAYGLAGTRVFEGGDGFDGYAAALLAADRERQSQDALLSALNWAWLHRDFRAGDYGAHAAEAALWARAGEATGGQVNEIFTAEALRSYCRFLDAHRQLGDLRYERVADWADGEVAGLSAVGCNRVVLNPVPDTPEVETLRVEARELALRGDMESADAKLTLALAREPDNAQIILQRADVRQDLVEVYARRDSAYRAARGDAEARAIELDSIILDLEENPRQSGLANWQDSVESWTGEILALEREVEAWADSLKTLNAEAWYDSATADANRALKTSPYMAEAYYIRGRVMYARATGADLLDPALVAKMTDQFDLALRYDPTAGDTHYYRGRALQRTDPREAARSYRRALESYPHLAWLWQDVAELEYELERFPEAGRAMDMAIGIAPEHVSYYDDRAVILRAMDQPTVDVERDRAEGYRRAALKLFQLGLPDSASATLGGSVGVLLLLADSEPEASIREPTDRAFNVGIEFGLQLDRVFSHAARWLEEEEYEALAVAAFDSAIARNPHVIDYWQDRFRVEVDAGVELGESARKTGHGIMPIGNLRLDNGDSEGAVLAYWRATIYFAGAEVYGEGGQGQAIDRPPGDDVRRAVEAMFDAQVIYLDGEAEAFDFFRGFISEGGRIDELLNEGDLRERIRFVIGLIVDERVAAAG